MTQFLSTILMAGLLMPGLAWADDLTTRYGLQVIDRDLSALVAPRVALPDRPVTMNDVVSGDETICRSTIARALASYPIGLVKALVRTVALAEDIHAWGKPVGGVQAPGLVVVDCQQPIANAPYQAAGIHDAVAALVINVAAPDWAKWRAANEPSFLYGDFDAYKAELSDTGAHDLATRLNRNGFVSRYSLVGAENDFQTYAEQAFGHGGEFASLVRQYPPMQQKLRILLDTYLALAPSLRGYFDQTGLANAAGLGPPPDAAAAQAQPTAAR